MAEPTYAQPELLAEPDWLESVRDDPTVRVIDCTRARERPWASIPGAAALPAHFSLKDPADPLHVIGPQPFAELMGRLGVSPETTVVAYDRHSGMAAARLWWVLSYYGHERAKVLNGGWHRWRAEQRPLASRPSEPVPARFTPRPNEAVLARMDYVRERLADGTAQILDVRNAAERAEPSPWGNRYGGVIPGALHWEWSDTLSADEQRRFRPAAELWAHLRAAGVAPEKEVITHCQAGIRSALMAFVLSLLGLERVRTYDASMKEWANTDGAPLVPAPATAPPDPRPARP